MFEICKKNFKKCKVLVTPTSFAKYDKNLKLKLEESIGKVVYNTTGKPLRSEQLLQIIGNFDGMIAGLDDINEEVLQSAKKLKVIARYGTGVDRINLEAAKKAGIYITNTPGANSVSVAELTIGLAIAAARSIPLANNEIKQGKWPRLKGVSLHGKIFGIIGLGNVGRQVVLRLKAFNCKIVAYDIKLDDQFVRENDIEFSSLDSLLARSDFVSLHLPASPQTIRMVNGDFLSKMKKEAILINTSRGELIDEDALFERLKGGHLRGAALDAFTKEPPDSYNQLLSLPRVIATPHMGAATDMAANEMGWMAVSECLSVLSREKPKFIVIEPDIK